MTLIDSLDKHLVGAIEGAKVLVKVVLLDPRLALAARPQLDGIRGDGHVPDAIRQPGDGPGAQGQDQDRMLGAERAPDAEAVVEELPEQRRHTDPGHADPAPADGSPADEAREEDGDDQGDDKGDPVEASDLPELLGTGGGIGERTRLLAVDAGTGIAILVALAALEDVQLQVYLLLLALGRLLGVLGPLVVDLEGHIVAGHVAHELIPAPVVAGLGIEGPAAQIHGGSSCLRVLDAHAAVIDPGHGVVGDSVVDGLDELQARDLVGLVVAGEEERVVLGTGHGTNRLGHVPRAGGAAGEDAVGLRQPTVHGRDLGGVAAEAQLLLAGLALVLLVEHRTAAGEDRLRRGIVQRPSRPRVRQVLPVGADHVALAIPDAAQLRLRVLLGQDHDQRQSRPEKGQRGKHFHCKSTQNTEKKKLNKNKRKLDENYLAWRTPWQLGAWRVKTIRAGSEPNETETKPGQHPVGQAISEGE